MKKHAMQIATAMISTTLGLSAHAGVFNGHFIGGANGLAGWQTLGDVSVMSPANALGLTLSAPRAMVLSTASLGADDMGAADGAYNLSGTSAVDVMAPGGLASFAGVDPTALELDPLDHTVSLIEGSAARQVVAIQAGDTLQFQWNLFSRDRDMPDTAWLIIRELGGASQVFTLAQADAATQTTAVDADMLQTGWQSFSYTFAHATSATLTWAVADMNDWGQTSLLAIQSVQTLPAVPEPESLALMLAALGAIGWQARTRRTK
ncbi:PEP-CTERM sorting domain-containing protein [Aquabacterium sp.]|uniref:PEP-CTERM sorting domain-containing protein n=1 Tax=Aquabacterium sp. TaxID=1872578 RepID=UPI002E3355CE|nr:PEP-CTERM sorting domain-containing protein [Aquabacterium sp.]HEX5312905.1 PEP-CTERM sorting domain-containing protein [Aquabacterium sp.]